MIEIRMIDGNNCPVLVCDICGDQITNAGKAAVVFNNFSTDGVSIKTLHVHKGKIDGKTCHQEADSIISQGGGKAGWQEMKTFLCSLAHNVGFPADEMASYAQRQQLGE